MKKSQCLQLGNFIYKTTPSGKEIVEIEQLSKFFINGIGISAFSEIPLTEEWFLDLGFIIRYFNEDKNKPLWWKVEGNRHIELYFEKQVNHHVFMINRFQYSIEIKHVHQLQNLYYALTGEQLIIKKQ